jgi:V/A-type H+-transporting ATPase subunit B
MSILHVGVQAINGPLIILNQVDGVGYEEVVDIRLTNGEQRRGRLFKLMDPKSPFKFLKVLVVYHLPIPKQNS